MVSSDKKAIFGEIDFLVLDSGEKVCINELSGKFDLSSKESSEILSAWCETQPNANLEKQYLVRGVDNSGNARITIVTEDRLTQFKSDLSNFTSYLFSLEIKAETRQLRSHQLTDGQRIALILKSGTRQDDSFDNHYPEDPSTEVESAHNDENLQKKLVTPKKEPTTPKKGSHQSNRSPTSKTKNAIQSMFGKIKPKVEPGKAIEHSSKKKSPNGHLSPKKEEVKDSKRGNISKINNSSISNFFSANAAQKTLQKESNNSSTDKILEIKSEPKEENHESEITDAIESKIHETTEITEAIEHKNTRKRSISQSDSDDVINSSLTVTVNPSKKAKLRCNKKVRSKNSRIIQMSDSSDDEGEEKENNQKDVSEIKKEIETQVLPNKESNLNGNIQNNRARAKRTVTKTYEENGFLVSKRVVEEYSCSEDDEKPSNETRSQPAPKSPAKTPTKKKVAKKLPTKQGSITSFFTKK